MRQERQENLFFGLSITNGINKSGKFMNICFAALLMFIALGCSANNSAKMTSFQNENAAAHNQNSNAPDKNAPVNDENSKTIVVKNGNSKTLDCNDPNEYSFVEVENPNRKDDADPLIPKDVNIVVGDKVIAKIELPKVDSEAKNFSLNSVEKTQAGFEMNVEWGGGLYHYEIQFNFRCKENNLYLYKVKTESFSTTNPDSGNYWDKKEIKETKIEPNLPIEKFSILDYLGNE